MKFTFKSLGDDFKVVVIGMPLLTSVQVLR